MNWFLVIVYKGGLSETVFMGEQRECMAIAKYEGYNTLHFNWQDKIIYVRESERDV